jgi:hypothetical protein
MNTQKEQHTTTAETTQEAPFPIASETTNTDQQAERPNKYHYPIFDGFSGERYLDSIILDILPAALARTWRLAVEHQAPGRNCYVGATRIAGRAKRSLRKIEIDLKVFAVAGLMRKYASKEPILQEDGTFVERAVVVKDFKPLYDLAYEYHLWTQSPEYIPPERDYADMIRADPQLSQKLIRFNNYRRILCTEVPGRKTQTSYQYQCNFHDGQEQQPRQAKEPPVQTPQKAKDFSQEKSNNSSPYRRSENNQFVTESTSTSTKNLEAMAIRKTTVVQNIEKDEIVQNSNETEENLEKATNNEDLTSKTTEIQQKKETVPEVAKKEIQEKEYTIEDLQNNPMAMTAFLLDLHAQDIQQQAEKPKRNRRKKDQRPRRGTPERLAQSIAYIVQVLGGNPKWQQSDITRATKMYWAATQIFDGFTNAWFLEILKEAFIDAANTRKVQARVPYFFKCLETRLELTADELAFIRSQEPLYKDGDIHAFKTTLRKAYEKSGTYLEYLEWVQQHYLPAPKV